MLSNCTLLKFQNIYVYIHTDVYTYIYMYTHIGFSVFVPEGSISGGLFYLIVNNIRSSQSSQPSRPDIGIASQKESSGLYFGGSRGLLELNNSLTVAHIHLRLTLNERITF